MKKSIFVALLILIGLFFSFKTEPVAYKIYNKEGKEVQWSDVINYAKKQEVVLFGEYHNNPISHWLQLKMTQDLHNEFGDKLVLGAEMFESDQQIIMNEFLTKKITEKNFEAEMRLWTNHKTDYKPLVNFALEKKLKFIATNIPRRYASMVSKKGKDELMKVDDFAKQFLCPLPLVVDTTLKGYENIKKMDMGHGSAINMVYAQASKDATMAHFIVKNLDVKGIFLHYNGAYHSDDFEGIGYYLNLYRKGTKTVTISTSSQKDVSKLDDEYKGKADFIIVVDEQMTSTH